MKNCSMCAAENPDEAVFCSTCGSAFAPAGAEEGGAPPPPPPYATPHTQYPPGGHQPGAPSPPNQYRYVSQVTNGKATASLVLGIIGLVACPIICSVLAIILGYSARNEIAASGGWQTGESSATAGIVLGWIGIALVVLGGIVWAIIAAIAVSAF